MLAMPTAHNSWGAVSVNGKPEPCENMRRPRRKSHVSKGERSALAFRTKQGHIATEEPRTPVKPSKDLSPLLTCDFRLGLIMFAHGSGFPFTDTAPHEL